MSKSLRLVIFILFIICLSLIPSSIRANTSHDYQSIQRQIYKYWFARKERMLQSNHGKKDLLCIEELEQINRVRIDNKLGDLTLFATLLIREGQSAIKNQQYFIAEKFIDYALILAPSFPLSCYAKGYLHMSQNWLAPHRYLKHYFMGMIKSLNHLPSLFIIIYENLLIIVFCSIFFYFLLTISFFVKYMPCYLAEFIGKFNKSTRGILYPILMILILFIPFIFHFSILWMLLYFLFILWPYLKAKGKILVFISFLLLIFFKPFVLNSFRTMTPYNINNYDFPSILIYEKIIQTGFNKINAMANLNQYKIVLDILSDFKKAINKNKIISLTLEPISSKYSYIIFSPLLFILFLFLMIIFRPRPGINRCNICLAIVNKMDSYYVGEGLLCSNCSLLYNKDLDKEQIIETNFVRRHNILKRISYFLPGFFSFFETEGIFNLSLSFIWYFFLIKFYLSLRQTLGGQFLLLNRWQIVLIFYVPLIILIYLMLRYRDNKMIEDKEKKIKAILD